MVAERKRQPISASADALEYRRTVAVPPYEILIQRLKTIKQLILKTIDSAKPYGVAMSCVEYLDLLINRIETIRIQNDFSDQRSRSLRFSALWDVVQMARPLCDAADWSNHPAVRDMINSTSDYAYRMVEDYDLWVFPKKASHDPDRA